MALFLHNTLTRAREPFRPADARRVTMYVCGPTVYNYAHIGNARPAVVFDVLARLLRRSYSLTYVRNVTDVDDKINDAAKAEGAPIGALTQRYLAAYHEDLHREHLPADAPGFSRFPRGCRSRSATSRLLDGAEHLRYGPSASRVCHLIRFR
jgi:cysteinyl-tRNA synthetase